MNQHGFCPKCNVDFDGELIFETFMKKYNALSNIPAPALEAAKKEHRK